MPCMPMRPDKGRVDVERFLGDARPFLHRHVVERPHVVQAVGELDQQDADVVRDGEQQLPEILALAGFLRDEVKALDLGQALDEPADLVAEEAVDLLARRLRILDRVVQHGRDDRRVVELEVGQDRGDFQRMREIGVARGAHLGTVRPHRIDIGAVQKILVGVRIVAPDAIDEFILPQDLGRRAAPRRDLQ